MNVEARSKEVDIEELMAGVKANLENGPPGVISGPTGLGRAEEDVATLKARWHIDGQRIVISHRPLIGGAINLFQRVVHRLTWWYQAPLIEQLSIFNGAVARAYERLARSQEQLIRLIQMLNEQVGKLEWLVRSSLGDTSQSHAPPMPGLSIEDLVPERMDYLGLEERFRGDKGTVRRNQAPYLGYFRGQENVVDLGCRRGEFLALLAEEGISAYGVDADEGMVRHCQEQGLTAYHDEALAHLRGVEERTLGGIFMGQFIEHLPFAQLQEAIGLAIRKLKPGAYLVATSPNPLTLRVSASTFWLDPTHLKPIHPEVMRFLLESAGFEEVEILFSSPFPEEDRFPLLSLSEGASPREEALIGELNRRIARLNDLLFGERDYAAIGRKGIG